MFRICVPVVIAIFEEDSIMSRRRPSTYLTADELKQIAAIKFNEAASAPPGPEQQKILRSAQGYENLAEMKRYLACKELQPPK
jgi:hypothetical protein